MRPAFLKEADRRICDQKEGHDAGLHVIAEKQLKKNGSFEHPGNWRPQLSKRATHGVLRHIRNRVRAQFLQPVSSFGAAQATPYRRHWS